MLLGKSDIETAFWSTLSVVDLAKEVWLIWRKRGDGEAGAAIADAWTWDDV